MEYKTDTMIAPLPEIKPFSGMDEWKIRRKELLDIIVDIEYGGMPPKPESVRIEQTQRGGKHPAAYRVHINEKFTFMLTVYLPQLEEGKKYPVILTGDGCYRNCSDEVIDEARERGYVVAKFNRTEFAHDMYNNDRVDGIYALYPDSTFGAIAAWAWGYSRAMDCLETLDFVDAERVAITGHSRGGKTVLLAGAVDERFAVVNPNDSGCGGAGCYRYYTAATAELEPSETLRDILGPVPYWFGPKLKAYIDREAELPFDQHFLKAAVAPRKLLETNARSDTWANPVGSYVTYEEAKKVFDALNIPTT